MEIITTHCLLDTNSISHYLSGSISEKAIEFCDSLEYNISEITEIELLCWRQEEAITNFIAACTIFLLTDDIKTATVKLRRERKMKLPDAIIAATALVNGFTLITNNQKDFRNIKGLKLLNLHDL